MSISFSLSAWMMPHVITYEDIVKKSTVKISEVDIYGKEVCKCRE